MSSAVARTPWEIWDRILAFVIACQLVPASPQAEDAFFDGIELLNTPDEKLAMTYRASERMRGILRLVCRSWKETVDPYSYRFYMGTERHIKDIVWSPRVHIISRVSFSWKYLELNKACSPLTEPPRTIEGMPILMSDKRVVQSLVLTGDDLSPLSDPSSFPNLRLLSLCLAALGDVDAAPNNINTLPLISQSWPNLTHLKLRVIQSSLVLLYQNQALVLPHLHTLSLTFVSKRRAPLLPTDTVFPFLSTFSLPSLRTLALGGAIHGADKRVIEEINALLRNVGPTLTGIVFELLIFDARVNTHHVPDDFWDWCPHITHLELTLPALLRAPPPPTSPRRDGDAQQGQKLNIVLAEPAHPFGVRHLPFLPWLTEFFETANELWPSHTRFVIPVTWRAFQQNLREGFERGQKSARFLKWLVVFRELLTEIQDKEYVIVDREGQGMESDGFEAFVEWLADPGESGKEHFLQTMKKAWPDRVERVRGDNEWWDV